MGAVAEVKRDAKAVAVAVMDAGAALCEHLQRQGLHSHLFSDIVLSFQGKDYALHRIVLSQSYYFHSLLTGPWKENGKPRVELKIDDVNVTPQGLEMAFHFLYGVNPVLTKETVVAVLAAGCFLCLEKLCERCVQFMVENLRVDTFLDYQQLSEQHCYGRFADRIRNACWTFLCTHASRELLNVLPKLTLPILCQLLQSDELWIPTELERYKLAKQAFIEWIFAHMKPVSTDNDCSCIARRMRGKFVSTRKHTRSVTAQNSSKGKASQKSGRCSNKDRGSKKESPAGEEQKEVSPLLHDDVNDTTLKRLKGLWESAAADQENVLLEDFRLVSELFTGGGIVFAHMEADEVLQVRKELEDANFPTAAADDSIWQHVLLKSRIFKLREPRTASMESSDDEEDELEEEEEEDDDDDEDEVEEEDEEEHSERDSSDSDGWSSDRSSQEEDENNSSDARAGNAGNGNLNSAKRTKLQSAALVCFNSPDGRSNDASDKRKKTSGGFSWIAKPDMSLLLSDFPPLRFGAEFILKDKRWTYVSDTKCPNHKAREVFYGGSFWKIFASNTTNLNQEKEGWLFGVHCRPNDTWEPHTYQDNRKKVRFVAKVYIKTNSGLSCVTGTGLRKRRHLASSFKNTLGMNLFHEDVILDEPLRVSAVVQLIED